MIARLARPPARLDPHEPHIGMIDERIKHPSGIAAAPHAGHHGVGQAAELPAALFHRLAADHRLEVADDPRKGMRANDRADDVVGGLDRTHPVTHRLVDRVAECAGATLHRPHLRPHEPHVADVGRLSPHVLSPHVDDAVESEAGTGRRRGHAMLAGAGLGDDPPLPHADGEQALTEGVVDLVGAGVAQILPLKIDLGAAGEFSEPLGEEQGGGPADKRPQQAVEFCRKRGISDGFVVGLLELLKSGGERLGHIPAAKPAKPPQGVWHLRERHLRKGRCGGRRCWCHDRGRGCEGRKTDASRAF